MTFTLNKKPVATAKPKYAPKLYTAELVVAEAYENLVAQGYAVRDLTDIVENIHQVTVAVNKHGIKGLEVLGTMTEGSLEAFIGAESMADAKLASASLEGQFTDALKNAWAAIKEWFARFYDWIRKMFFSLEADLKHLEGLVAPENDSKFNPNTKYDDPFPTKDAVEVILRATNVCAEKSLPVLNDIAQVYEDLAKLDLSKVAAGDQTALDDLKSKLQQFSKKIETSQKEMETALQQDPVLKNFAQNTENTFASLKDPIEVMKAINAGYIKSGSAADLGYKTGADIRAVVTEFAKYARAANASVPVAERVMKAVNQVADNAAKVAADNGVPPDFIKLGKTALGLVNKMNGMTSKLLRWALLFVTRAVRRMYNNAPSNSVAAPAAAAAPAQEPAKPAETPAAS